MFKPLLSLSLLTLAMATSVAQAHQPGDVIVRAGAITVDPHERSGTVRAAGTPLPGTGASLDSDTQLGLNLAYMLSEHVAIELLAATPFTHAVGTRGLGGLALGELKHLPPTVSALYYPLDTNAAVQPYLGGGLNYTRFFDDRLGRDAEAAGFRGLEMDDSWGLAGQLGVDVMLTERLMVNAQVRYLDIDTTGTTRLGTARVEVDVEVDPWVYMVGLGYRF